MSTCVNHHYTQEIRYAVVMYGGISLAIYMNGIAQEMLRLVRSTSVADPGLLSGTEEIYRELSCLLHLRRKPGDRSLSEAPRTRFVIDLLSGTSAGGINAVFLAKALARKSKDLEELRRLWMSKADIDSLLNDAKSEEGGRYPVSSPKKSLLNSRRMYGLLREAFSRMDEPAGMEKESAETAERIDLYVTATDLNGLAVPVELTDKPLLERVHRSVFHFEYDPDEGVDHFKEDNNTMLAFAARCTSSFPVAFEPMRFCDIRPVPTQQAIDESRPFFESYTVPGDEMKPPLAELDFQDRVFADGGYLDNRPFGYVIDRIGERTSRYAAFRKLVFVDPFPEHLDRRTPKSEFSFDENALLAASTLPRYETIRQDLSRIIDANRRARCAAEIEKTVFRLDPTGADLVCSRINNYREAYMDELLKEQGPLFVTDQMMKVSSISNWLAEIATRQLGFNESGDYYRVVRLIVSAWRREHFLAIRPKEGDSARRSETEFISRYDMAFRLCRLRYVIYMIDRVTAYSDQEFEDFREHLALNGILREAESPVFGRESFLDALHPVRKRNSELLAVLHRRKKRIEARSRILWLNDADMDVLRNAMDSVRKRLAGRDLLRLFFFVDAAQQKDYARELYEGASLEINEYFEILASVIRGALAEVYDERGTLARETESSERLVAVAARWIVRLWDTYEVVGHVMERLLPNGQIGESGAVDIFRIGPADTDLTIRNAREKEEKLAGAKLGAFGAFLSEGWRENDILWGRLDGAERLIVSLLPDAADRELRDDYIRRVREAILAEEFDPANGRIYRWFAGQVQNWCGPGLSGKQLAACMDASRTGPLQEVLKTLQEKPARWQSFLTAYYDIPSGPDRGRQAEWLSRAVRIGGEMLEGRQFTGIGRKVKYGGLALFELVQVSLPGSLRHFWFSHILVLLMLAGAILIALGALFAAEFASVGLKLFFYAGAIWIMVRSLRSWFSRGPFWQRVLAACCVILAAATLVLVGLGFGVMKGYVRDAQDMLSAWLS
jgi:patatin-related protein